MLSPDLYQLLSYVVATRLRYGMLLYAETADTLQPEQRARPTEPIRYPELVPAHTAVHLLRRGLNLSVEPAQLLAQIESIGAEICTIISEEMRAPVGV